MSVIIIIIIIIPVLLRYVQILQILPESVFYGRHLLKEGDYITSANGRSLEHLPDTECDELLTSLSTVVRIELLRKINMKTSASHNAGLESSSKTVGMEVPVTKDDQLDRRYEGPSFRRRSLPNELNQNVLFARSKLRMFYPPGFDSDSPRHEHNQEQSRQTLRERQVLDSIGFTSSHAQEEKSSEPGACTDSLKLIGHAQVENPSAVESSKVPRARKNHLSTITIDKSQRTLNRRTIKHSKGVRFKLSTKDKKWEEKRNEEEARTQDQVSSADRPLLSGKQHKVIDTATVSYANSLSDFTDEMRCAPAVSQRLGATRSIVLTSGNQQVSSSRLDQKNRDIKPSTSEQDRDFSTPHDAVDSVPVLTPPTTSTEFTPQSNIPNVQDVFDEDFRVPSNAPTLKIYTSVITLGSHGNVLTTRVTPPAYEPFRQSVFRPFMISVIQGLTGLGIEVAVIVPAGTVITSIVESGPVGKNGNVRYGLFPAVIIIFLFLPSW